MPTLHHGGNLGDARRLSSYDGPWLDLSTGINPHPYPADIACEWLTRLPSLDALKTLLAAARSAYGVPDGAGIVAAPGTQALLQLLPTVLPAGTVNVLSPTYEEHAAIWARSARVTAATALCETGADLWVVVNPNNPDGRSIDPATLVGMGEAATPGTVRVVVDEAFGDVAPHLSVAGRPGTLVLRSFGKFFGLAGVRLGFAIGPPAVTDALAEALGPWAVSGPAIGIGTAALNDTGWAERMRRQLARERALLDTRLERAGFSVLGGTDLFRLAEHGEAQAVHRRLAESGIWTRRFKDRPQQLRFGLPGAGAEKLFAALAALHVSA